MLLLYGIIGVFILLAWPQLVLLHELGHAVPALLFTRANVVMYLGSYGDSAHSWRVQAGPLEIYLKRSLFWAGGMCVHRGSDLTRSQQVIILVGGVAVSLAVAGLGFYGALVLDLHGAIKLLLFLLTFLAATTLVTNLIPSERSGFANDGLLLKRLLAGDKSTVVFSPELQALIAGARLMAIRLGYDHISTLHAFLADCAMPYDYSLAGLYFPDPASRKAFYERQRVGPPGVADAALPLTTEFEQVLQMVALARRYGLSREIYPCHLFVVASEVAGSAFGDAMSASPRLTKQLLTYYRPFRELWA